jgi:hypothetical protein
MSYWWQDAPPVTSFLIAAGILQMRLKIVLILLLLALLPPRSGISAPESGLAVYQEQLLQTAFDAVSKMPADPHVRNRSRAQEKIVAACLELDAPEKAAIYADAISNWRRGTACADIALYYARKGDPDAARSALAKAERLVENGELVRSGEVIATGDFKDLAASLDEWRLDRVKAHIARVYTHLRETGKAARWSDRIAEEETHRVKASEASICAEDGYATVRDALKQLADTEDFEAVKSALLGFCTLYSRFYADSRKRLEIEGVIEHYLSTMPGFMQIESRISMAATALDHEDPETARAWVREAEAKLENARYRPRMYFPMKASITSLLFRAGDTTPALANLEDMNEKYNGQRDGIVDIYRAAILCRIAEAGAALGRVEKARQLYQRAAAEAVVNPNSRPRADDLSEICRSMAVHQVEPAPALRRELTKIMSALGTPW